MSDHSERLTAEEADRVEWLRREDQAHEAPPTEGGDAGATLTAREALRAERDEARAEAAKWKDGWHTQKIEADRLRVLAVRLRDELGLAKSGYADPFNNPALDLLRDPEVQAL